jgi:MarR-like DNA-binding transcriptional regulator SgrR of sgrS sRNA
LRNNVQFSDNIPVTIVDLANTLKRVHAFSPSIFGKIKNIKKIDEEKNCLIINLEKRHLDYFDTLSSPFTAITKYIQNINGKKILLSTGSYRVQDYNEANIYLEAVPKKVKGDLKKINFIKCIENDCIDNAIDDWNYSFKPPIEIEKKIKKNKIYPIYSSTVIGFVVNMKDSKMRKEFGKCLNLRSKEILNVFEGSADTIEHNTLIPKEYLKNQNSTFQINQNKSCNFKSHKQKIILMDYNKERLELLKNYFLKIRNQLPILIEPRLYSTSEQKKLLKTNNSVMAIVAITSEGIAGSTFYSVLGFFESFLKSNSILKYTSDKIDFLISNAINASSFQESELYINQAQQELLSKGIYIPFGLRRKKLSLPTKYTNIIFPSLFSRFPSYDKILIKKDKE